MNKAETLLSIKLKKSIIPYLKRYYVKDYLKNKETTFKDIQKLFKSKVAIRSSFDEDGEKKSNAGKYTSSLNVNPEKTKSLDFNINKVISSFNKKKDILKQQFFVQLMVPNVKLSGVVTTIDLKSHTKKYVINYFQGKNTTFVTSGKKNTKVIKYIDNIKYKLHSPFNKLIQSVKEIENLFYYPLDIEFIIDKNNKVHIVQIRKLITKKIKKINFSLVEKYSKLEKKINKLKKNHYNLLGKDTYFGVMPDWNPAEIIGIKPKPLALSLYQELITNKIWSESRKNYGYKDVTNYHLMTTFYGTPYVDMRIDLNSWLPKDLDNKIQIKLLNHYLMKFKKSRHLHDKIEKDIIFTSYNLDTENRVNYELSHIFDSKDKKKIISSLKNLNLIALEQQKKDIHKINKLIEIQNKIESSNMYYLEKVYWHIEECKKYGTLPFVGLARCGFIGINLLNSLVSVGIFSDYDRKVFLQGINTITSSMNKDLGKSKKSNFLKKYGHIRPNTYEINSLNYKDGFNVYFEKNIIKKRNSKFLRFQINQKQITQLNKFIKKSNFNFTHKEFLEFIENSIKYREYSKFVFSKSIDLIFFNIKEFSKKFSINQEDLSFLDLDQIVNFYFNLSFKSPIKNITDNVKKNKKEFKLNSQIDLPRVIIETKDLYLDIPKDITPNFITNKNVHSPIHIMSDMHIDKLKNKIVCIENADPGYDFIFSKGIKGLITKFGGYNSHMAIRCNELNLPAAIGVGDEIYNNFVDGSIINLDCLNKKIELL